ncbi:MAG TPA: tetratricopeptide repeat protein [Gemmatimonadales bacterium]|jgi:tetratricopeptide (TPR) repeat protein|nr:tetratricopeptide repeat protein [Gemmatimonadales bacterium]
MTEPYLSSDEYDEKAHQLYNEARYDEALALLREGLIRYSDAVDLHVGLGYAQLAREEYGWARRAFADALGFDPDHEDALAGVGETLLVLGQIEGSLRAFQRLIDLGFDDDHELMLQVGRALFREGFFAEARRFFERVRTHHPDSPEVAASLGYTAHRLGFDAEAFYWLRRALQLEPDYHEPRIYLANVLYDRGEVAAALRHFARVRPEDHFDDLGVWRTIELLKSTRGVGDDHRDIRPWLARLAELGQESSADAAMLAEIENRQPDGTSRDPNQLELFGTLMRDVPEMQRRPSAEAGSHVIETLGGLMLRGSWDDLVLQLQAVEGAWADGTVTEFMHAFARRGSAETGVKIPLTGSEPFLRGAAAAGVIRILQ